ncbi:MAG: BLUF domain-containing protein [Burkholderiales bacterium]|nr:MAG: BLUF domain-containing protein [Burkholderiales bacterium]
MRAPRTCSMRLSAISPGSALIVEKGRMQMSEIYRLIYVSAARVEMTTQQLDSILASARRKNAFADVTGLLLYHDGSFFQVLEGERAAVTAIFSTIEKDHRHSRVIRLQARIAEARAFPNWSMGFMKAHALRPDQQECLVDLSHLAGRDSEAKLTSSPTVAVHVNAFLGTFREFAEL